MARAAAPLPLGALVLVALAVAVLAAGCRPGYRPGPPPEVDPGIRVAVLPFWTGGEIDEQGRFVAATDPPAMPERLGEDAMRTIIASLLEMGVGAVDVTTMLRATPEPGAAIYGTELGVRVGKKVDAHYALVGAVSRYRERKGSALGVESPASVAYRAVLVEVATGRLVSTYTFDFTQAPLSEELTQLPEYLQGGGGWQTRQQILDRSLPQTARKVARTLSAPPVP
jgi:hypothetical protein